MSSLQTKDDDYEVVGEPIFEGQTTTVLKVRRLVDNKILVRKEVNLTTLERKAGVQVVEQISREDQILVGLNCPYIVQVYDKYTVQRGRDSFYCLILEYCEEGDLRSLLLKQAAKKEYIEESVICKWARQLVSAVTYLHQRGYIHRDIKPENILFTKNDLGELVLKLGDFGISKHVVQLAQKLHTNCGTEQYSSPERLANQPYSHKCDVWAVGVVVSEIASLVHPFSTGNFTTISKTKIINDEIPPLPVIYGDQLRAFVTRLTQKDPDNRPSIFDIGKDLFLRDENEFVEAWDVVAPPRANTSFSDASNMSAVGSIVNVDQIPLCNTTMPALPHDNQPPSSLISTAPSMQHLRFAARSAPIPSNKAEARLLPATCPPHLAISSKKQRAPPDFKYQFKKLIFSPPFMAGSIFATLSIVIGFFVINLTDLQTQIDEPSAFMTAIEQGNIYRMESLLARNPKLGMEDFDWKQVSDNSIGSTPLHLAAKLGRVDAFKLLLEKTKLTLKQTNKAGNMPIHEAGLNNRAEIVALILQSDVEQIRAKGWRGRTPLHFAATTGNLDMLDLLAVRHGASIGATSSDDDDRSLPLHLAADSGRFDVVNFFITQKSDLLEFVDSKGNTALLRAVRHQHADIVRLLISKQANIEAKGENGRTALLESANVGNADIFRMLILNDADSLARSCNKTDQGSLAIHLAASNDRHKMLGLIVESGAGTVHSADSDGNTALWRAAEKGNLLTVAALLTLGSNVDAVGRSGWTPFQAAVASGNVNTVELLYNRSSLNSTKIKEAVQLAASLGHLEVQRFLVEQNSEAIDSRDLDNNTLLHHAAKAGHMQTIEFLLANGINVNEKGADDRTALHDASAIGHYSVVTLLVSKGADINAVTRVNKELPYHLAAARGHVEIVSFLLNKYNDVAMLEVKDSNGNTALWLAAANGHEAVVESLLTRRANHELYCGSGRTALQEAANNGHLGVVRSLLARQAKVYASTSNKIDEGAKAIHLAARNGYADVVEEFLKTNGDLIDATDRKGRSPLWLAAANCKVNVAQALLKHGDVEIELRDHSGWTPLLAAAASGCHVIAELLLEKGAADCYAKSSGVGDSRSMAIHFAADGNHIELIRLILSKHSDQINATDELGRNCLLRAVAKGHVGIVDELLSTHINADVEFSGDGRTALLTAAFYGHANVAQLLLTRHASVHAVSTNEADNLSMSIHVAASRGFAEIVELILAYNEKQLDTQNKAGNSPLCLAAANGHLNVLDVLFTKRRPNKDIKCAEGRTPLIFAATGGHTEIVRRLIHRHSVDVFAKIDSGDQRESQAIHLAAELGFSDIVQILVEKDAGLLEVVDASMNTPLWRAAARGQLGVVKYFVNQRANVKATGLQSLTPMLAAASGGYLDVLVFLIDNGASEDDRNEAGYAAIHLAAAAGYDRVVDYFINRNDSLVNLRSADSTSGNTPLWLAAANGRENVVDLLMKANALVESVGLHGKTPLLAASSSGHVNTVRKLHEEHEASLEARDENEANALHLAAANGHLKVAEYILSKNDDVIDSVDAIGDTALHRAAWNGYLKVAEFLLQRGAKFRVANNKGKTAKDYAERRNHKSVYVLLATTELTEQDETVKANIALANVDENVDFAADASRADGGVCDEPAQAQFDPVADRDGFHHQKPRPLQSKLYDVGYYVVSLLLNAVVCYFFPFLAVDTSAVLLCFATLVSFVLQLSGAFAFSIVVTPEATSSSDWVNVATLIVALVSNVTAAMTVAYLRSRSGTTIQPVDIKSVTFFLCFYIPFAICGYVIVSVVAAS